MLATFARLRDCPSRGRSGLDSGPAKQEIDPAHMRKKEPRQDRAHKMQGAREHEAEFEDAPRPEGPWASVAAATINVYIWPPFFGAGEKCKALILTERAKTPAAKHEGFPNQVRDIESSLVNFSGPAARQQAK